MRAPKKIATLAGWFSRQSYMFKACSIAGSLFLVFLILVISLASYFKLTSEQPRRIGVSFSQKQAIAYGLDWKQAYTAAMSELGITDVRLMSYWDRFEPSNNRYDFAELDFMMDSAAKNDVAVSLVVGNRQPRWPECHTPEWVYEQPAVFEEELLEYIAVVAYRYTDHPALRQFQLENEAANNSFGHCPDFNKQFFNAEYEQLAQISTKPIAITLSNQSGVATRGPIGDKTGFSIYRHAHFPLFGRAQYWSFGYVPSFWHSARAGFMKLVYGSTPYVHELQMEPWAKGPTETATSREQYELFPPTQFRDNLNYVDTAGFTEVYMWGVEWWYWRAMAQSDPNHWLAAKQAVSEFLR